MTTPRVVLRRLAVVARSAANGGPWPEGDALRSMVAAVMETLDDSHCPYCETVATGINAWWSDPNAVQGISQLADILGHLAGMGRRSKTI